MVGHNFEVYHKIIPQNFVVDFVVGVFSVKWKKSLKFHKKSKVDVVAAGT